MPGFDLHTHTTFSDGTTIPERNVELAVKAGLVGLAITDHDTAAGWQPMREAAAGTGLEIIGGVELSAELDGFSVHILGYWFDPQDADLSAEMDRLAGERERRAGEIVAKFNALDIPVTLEHVRGLAGQAPIGRPHVAAAVVETGAADSVQEVFDRWLHDGGPAYAPKYAVSPGRCVELIVAAGGVAVLAHPGLYGRADRARTGTGLDGDAIAVMVEAGLAGIEADHPDHDTEDRLRYREIAQRHDLVVTAGSDFHGERKDLDLGQARTEVEAVDALRERRTT